MPALDGGDEGQEFVEVALRMNLVVGERRDEVVAAAEVFVGLSARPHLLNGNAEDGGWSWVTRSTGWMNRSWSASPSGYAPVR